MGNSDHCSTCMYVHSLDSGPTFEGAGLGVWGLGPRGQDMVSGIEKLGLVVVGPWIRVHGVGSTTTHGPYSRTMSRALW